MRRSTKFDENSSLLRRRNVHWTFGGFMVISAVSTLISDKFVMINNSNLFLVATISYCVEVGERIAQWTGEECKCRRLLSRVPGCPASTGRSPSRTSAPFPMETRTVRTTSSTKGCCVVPSRWPGPKTSGPELTSCESLNQTNRERSRLASLFCDITWLPVG